jgi:inhibitor of cysteine peptidase
MGPRFAGPIILCSRDVFMKRLIPLAAVAALLVFAPIHEADAARRARSKKVEKIMQVTDADSGKTVAVASGKSFDLVLKANATTGFQWQIDKIESDAVQQVGKDEYVPDKHAPGIVGVGGKAIFHFNAAKAAKTKIRLVYVRPWEKDTPPVKTFEVTIDSTAGAATAPAAPTKGDTPAPKSSP